MHRFENCHISYFYDAVVVCSRLTRKNVLYANTQFTCAQYDPSGVQVLATGTDRRITYWEVFDASLVREIEGSAKGSINCVSINWSGEMFVSAGNDQIVKVITIITTATIIKRN